MFLLEIGVDCRQRGHSVTIAPNQNRRTQCRITHSDWDELSGTDVVNTEFILESPVRHGIGKFLRFFRQPLRPTLHLYAQQSQTKNSCESYAGVCENRSL